MPVTWPHWKGTHRIFLDVWEETPGLIQTTEFLDALVLLL